ncbi:MAG: glycosyltransferase, partial [Chitinispirillaceae bacterium]|nr:glycosyltransferase [Chitinispirillaceae bacterium]
PDAKVIVIDIHPHPSQEQATQVAQILLTHGCSLLVTVNEWGLDATGVLHAILETHRIIHCNWSVDDPFFEEIIQVKKFRPSALRIDFVSDKGYLQPMNDRGYRARFLPLAVDPQWFHPDPAGPEVYDHDIIFVGNSYLRQMDDLLKIAPGFVDTLAPFLGAVVEAYHRNVEYDVEGHIARELERITLPVNLSFEKALFIAKHAAGYLGRKQIVLALAKRYPAFKVFGESGWLRELPKERLGTAKYYDTLCATYRRAKITVDINRMVIRNGFTQRAFDVPASGAFLITSSKPVVREYFKTDGPEAEIAVFKTRAQLFERIDYYLASDEDRRAMAQRGMKKVLAAHTYDHRIAEMFSVVSARIVNGSLSPAVPE